MFRIISEVRPYWVVGENVAGHVSLGLDNVLSDLESVDYSTQAFIVPARAVGALHVRERIFIVANSDSKSMAWGSKKEIQREQVLQGKLHGGGIEEWPRRCTVYEPKLSRTYNGLPNGVDRIKALGNAVVPQQIYPIFAAIAEIERCKDAI